MSPHRSWRPERASCNPGTGPRVWRSDSCVRRLDSEPKAGSQAMSYGPVATVLLLTAILLHSWPTHAASVAVRFAEGVARGFPVLGSVAGEHRARAILSALIAALPSSAAAGDERSRPFFVAHRLVDGEVSKI